MRVPEKAKQLAGTLGAAFLCAVYLEYKGLGVGLFDLDSATLRLLANAGLDAVGATVVAWLAPFVKSYGVGSDK